MPDLRRLKITEAREFVAALADVLCWFQGFRAARRHAALPQSMEDLRELNIALKAHIDRLEAPNTIAPMHKPETDIGSGCRVSFDGSSIWLRRPVPGPDHLVALDIEGLTKLNEFMGN